MALPIDPQPTPTVPIVVSELSAPASNNIAIASIIPTDPLSLHVYDPKDHIMWEKTSWKSGGECALSGQKIRMTSTTGSLAVWTTQETNFQCELAEIL